LTTEVLHQPDHSCETICHQT